MTTLLFAKHDNKSLNEATRKALTPAKALGAPVHILVAGLDCRAVAEAAAKLDGVEKVRSPRAPAMNIGSPSRSRRCSRRSRLATTRSSPPRPRRART